MSTKKFPNIPDVEGVPAIPRPNSYNFPPEISGISGLVQGELWRIFENASSKWGIYDKFNRPLGDPNLFYNILNDIAQSFGFGGVLSTNSITIQKETRVSDFPIERGSFASYNKVEMPTMPRVLLCYGGDEQDRATFVNALDKASKSTDLYTIITPEKTYLDYNIERYEITRSPQRGAYMIYADIQLREIRQITPQYSQVNSNQINNPKNPGATPSVSSGQVQAQPISDESDKMLNSYEIPGVK